MESSSIGGQWSISPTSSLSGFLLAALILYLSFRHMLFTLMFMDIVIGWMRRFNWFPKEGKRIRTVVHNCIAWGLLVAFLTIAGSAGWLVFTPMQQYSGTVVNKVWSAAVNQEVVETCYAVGFLFTWLGLICLTFPMIIRTNSGKNWRDMLSLPYSEVSGRFMQLVNDEMLSVGKTKLGRAGQLLLATGMCILMQAGIAWFVFRVAEVQAQTG